jgi:hypothetical protein
MAREQKPEAIKKIVSVWDWNSKPSVMAKDTSLRRSQAATKGRAIHGNFPAHMQIFKEKK